MPIENKECPGSLRAFQKEGEEMKKKTESKGTIFDFIDDAARDPEKRKKMVRAITTKGEGLVANKLLKQFHDMDYKCVTLQDCQKLLEIMKKDIAHPESWDWSY